MFQFENVWQNTSEALAAELQKFTDKGDMGGISSIVFVARTNDGRIAGVSSAAKRRVAVLSNNILYEIGCHIVVPDAGLEAELTKRSIDLLCEMPTQSTLPGNAVGVFSVFRKEKDRTRVVWPEHKMYLIGFTKNDHPIGVRYFKGARI